MKSILNLIKVFRVSLLIGIICLIFAGCTQAQTNSAYRLASGVDQLLIHVDSDVDVVVKECVGSRIIVQTEVVLAGDMPTKTLNMMNEYFQAKGRYGLKAKTIDTTIKLINHRGTQILGKDKKIVEERVKMTILIPSDIKTVNIIS